MKDKNITPAGLRALAEGDLENFIVASTPGGIEAQEKRGQETFVNSEILPIEAPWEQLEKMGIEVDGNYDELFLKVKLPKGWRKEATDHSMWSHLLDDKGRKRASIFYKAAFYDRRSDMHLDRRFNIERNWDLKNQIQYVVKDGDSVIYETEKSKVFEDGDREQYKVGDEIREVAEAWLKDKYPDWQNHLAYWE